MGLTLNGLNILSKLEELKERNEQTKKWVLELEKALEVARADVKKAWDEIGLAKDKVKEAELERLQARKSFEEDLVKARAQAIEDFKQSNEFGTLLGQYESGLYHYGLQFSQSYLRTKLPDDLQPVVENLKTVNKLAHELELFTSDVEDDEVETPI